MKTPAALFALVFLTSACAPAEEAGLESLRRDEALRQEIFLRWMEATLRADAEAREEASENTATSLQASNVYDVYDRHLAEVASEFGIPAVEVLAIQVEGLASGWPRPEE